MRGIRAPSVAVTEESGGSLAEHLRSRGAEVFSLPTIRIEPPEDFGPLDRAIAEIDRFDWIAFTSRHAVEAVVARPAWNSVLRQELPLLRVAAVGRSTAARLTELGVTADLVPEEAGASGLARTLASTLRTDEPSGISPAAREPARPLTHPSEAARPTTHPPGSEPADPTAAGRLHAESARAERPLRGVRVLWPRSDIARRELTEALESAGAEVTDPVAYRTTLVPEAPVEELARRLASGSLDAIAFLSPSSARNLSALLGAADLSGLAKGVVIASIGPTTSAALRELAAPPDVESSARSAEDLAETLVSYLRTRGSKAGSGPPGSR